MNVKDFALNEAQRAVYAKEEALKPALEQAQREAIEAFVEKKGAQLVKAKADRLRKKLKKLDEEYKKLADMFHAMTGLYLNDGYHNPKEITEAVAKSKAGRQIQAAKDGLEQFRRDVVFAGAKDMGDLLKAFESKLEKL
jgi:hypothetical protein